MKSRRVRPQPIRRRPALQVSRSAPDTYCAVDEFPSLCRLIHPERPRVVSQETTRAAQSVGQDRASAALGQGLECIAQGRRQETTCGSPGGALPLR